MNTSIVTKLCQAVPTGWNESTRRRVAVQHHLGTNMRIDDDNVPYPHAGPLAVTPMISAEIVSPRALPPSTRRGPAAESSRPLIATPSG
jgi:hypothetical protein